MSLRARRVALLDAACVVAHRLCSVARTTCRIDTPCVCRCALAVCRRAHARFPYRSVRNEDDACGIVSGKQHSVRMPCTSRARMPRLPLPRPRHRLGEAGQRGRQLLDVGAGDAVQLAGEHAADGGLLLVGAVLQHIDVMPRQPDAQLRGADHLREDAIRLGAERFFELSRKCAASLDSRPDRQLVRKNDRLRNFR
jgi:hypothetical protein